MVAPELGSHALLVMQEKRFCTAHPNGFYAANVMV
jgi:hypothetical protein